MSEEDKAQAPAPDAGAKEGGAGAGAAEPPPKRVMKAPPKSTPPADGAAAKEDGADAKAGGEAKKPKKSMPPPSNPPPQGGNAAAAFRAKSTVPPPNGPPPTGGIASASVAKIRGAARPPSAGPPPSGAKPVGAPPSGAPPGAKPRGGPPGSAPPGAKPVAVAGATAGAAPTGATAAPAAAAAPKPAMTAPKSEAKPIGTGSEPSPMPGAAMAAKDAKPEAKKPTPMPTRTPMVAAEQKRPATGPPAAKATPVDILGDSSPILDASPSVEAPTLVPKKVDPVPAVQRQNTTMAQQPAAAAKVPIVKRSTMDVLNDTNASLSARSRSIEEPEAKRAPQNERAQTAAIAASRAVPYSGPARPNVPDEEFITVKKQEPKKAEGEDSADSKKVGEDKVAKNYFHPMDDLDDVEEIPFLEEEKLADSSTEAKKTTSVATAANDDDPVIVFETKGPPKGSNARTASFGADAKGSEHKSNNAADDKDDEALLSRGNKDTPDDIYDELCKLKRGGSPTNDEATGEPQSSSSSSLTTAREGSGNDEESKETNGSRDGHSSKSREKRKEKKRNKHEDEPKKLLAQFFNPKCVPYVPDHLLDFVKRPLECGRGHIVKCFIERNDSGQNKLAPIYTLLLEVNSSSGRPIMYARKKATSRITSHYVISLNKEDLFLPRMMRSHQYVGKLRSSTSMMEYYLYDQGDNPEDLDSDCEIDEEIRKNIRAELAVIRYHNSKKQYARKMEVAIPSITEGGGSYLDWRPISRDQMMEEHVRAITAAGGQNVLDTSNFIFMHKRETKYDPLSSCIVDFRSRATCVSVKNFQLVHSEPTNDQMKEKYRKTHTEFVYDDQGTVSLPQEYVLLQLGKVGKDCFNMDFQHPLSMLQAFAISLSRFDTKQR